MVRRTLWDDATEHLSARCVYTQWKLSLLNRPFSPQVYVSVPGDDGSANRFTQNDSRLKIAPSCVRKVFAWWSFIPTFAVHALARKASH